MRSKTYGIAGVLTILASGVGLATATGAQIATFDRAISMAASLIGASVLLAGMFRRSTGRTGFWGVLGGWIGLTMSAAMMAVPEIELMVAGWLGATPVGLLDPGPLLQAVGTIGVVVGCGMWTVSRIGAPHDADGTPGARTDQVARLQERLNTVTRQLAEAKTTDDLTGTLNRKTFIERVDDTIRRDTRLRKPMAFLLIEITEFRATERPQGRLAADLVRQFVAKALLSTTRGTDFVGRLGEDQFAVVLGECNDSQPAIARLLLALEDPTIPDADAPGGRRSISLIVHAGCVEVPVAAWCQGFGHLFHLAEERMRSVQTIRKSHAAKTVLGSSEHEGTAAG